jgi:hypothetical protein
VETVSLETVLVETAGELLSYSYSHLVDLDLEEMVGEEATE